MPRAGWPRVASSLAPPRRAVAFGALNVFSSLAGVYGVIKIVQNFGRQSVIVSLATSVSCASSFASGPAMAYNRTRA